MLRCLFLQTSLTTPILDHHYPVLKRLAFCQRFGDLFAVFKLWATCPEVTQTQHEGDNLPQFCVEVKKAWNITSASESASCCGAYVQEELCLYHLPPQRNKGKYVTFISNSSTIAADGSNGVTNTRCCRYSYLRSWWWVMVPPETRREVSR
jgi:hypothetical protein